MLDASLFTVTVTSNDSYEDAFGEGYVAALPTQANGKITIAQEGTADSNGVGTFIHIHSNNVLTSCCISSRIPTSAILYGSLYLL